ncbi:PTS transporter subunit EIIC [Paenibacillus sp. CMAA1739]|uniref:PTS transporter subunit EIIC n=1 Tax=Paenibacillus ottowii TaxID=2315729 RepID=UPI00272FE00C|nr:MULTISPECIES: PTS transporter subunit EIIC [Paenibacillus]MDP1509627.1 PTS transporter subunit EIIC [Paenibacillus ottowii]MEC4566910.1 PTS transporter subunit EIIC [Paenibacillus sp. CMAA1739]
MDRELPSKEINSWVKGENLISRLFVFISGVFTPLLPLLIGGGIIQGIATALLVLDFFSDTQVFTALGYIGGSVFYFLPVMIAINAARKLGSNIFIAAAIGACSYSPGIIELLQSSLKMNSDGLPVVEQQYLASFILILIGVWLASKIEKGLKRFDRYSVQLLVVPTLTLIIIVPLLLFVFGPLWTTLAHNLSDGFASLFDDAEVLAGLLFGGTIPVLHFAGMQYMMLTNTIESIAATGHDSITPVVAAAVMAQAGAAFGVCVKSKNVKVKTLAASTGLLAMFGIIEPALYGVNVRFKKPLIAGLVGGAVGGACMCLFEVKLTAFAALSGLLSLPLFSDATLVYAILSMLISFITAGLITYFMGFVDEKVDQSKIASASRISTSSDSVVEKSSSS